MNNAGEGELLIDFNVDCHLRHSCDSHNDKSEKIEYQ